MDDQRDERREHLPEHETRPERDAPATSGGTTDPEATDLDKVAIDPHDIDIEMDDSDGGNEVPPISRSG